MNLARSSTRWVGQPMFHPQNERGRSPRGRQRHYRAVELAGAGEQVYVNDLVEVIDGLEGLSGVAEEHPRLAQVKSYTCTGMLHPSIHPDEMWLVTSTKIEKGRTLLLVSGRV